MMWYDMMWYDMIWLWYDMIWYDMIWYDVTWCDMIWCDMMWCDVMWYDAMWCDVMWYDAMWCDVMWLPYWLRWASSCHPHQAWNHTLVIRKKISHRRVGVSSIRFESDTIYAKHQSNNNQSEEWVELRGTIWNLLIMVMIIIMIVIIVFYCH
jgi:hypothetical protein